MATKTTKAPLTNRKPATKKGENELSSKKMFLIPVDKIEVEEGFNKRIDYGTDDFQTLQNSIKKKGVQEPIRVIPNPNKKGFYILREGHRRFKAVTLINKMNPGHVKKVLAMISTQENREDSLVRMISANDGKTFSKIEKGFVCIELKNNGWAVKDIAEETGMDINEVYHCISLAELPKKYHMPIAQGVLSGNKILAVFKECNGNEDKAEKIIDDAKKRASKQVNRDVREGKESKKVKHAQVTGAHFKNLKSSTDRQKIFDALKIAEKRPELYNKTKVEIIGVLYGLLDTKANSQEIADMMKK